MTPATDDYYRLSVDASVLAAELEALESDEFRQPRRGERRLLLTNDLGPRSLPGEWLATPIGCHDEHARRDIGFTDALLLLPGQT